MSQRKDAVPLVRNFALVYLEMAMERASAEARAAVLPELLQGIGAKPAQHRDMLLRMAMAALQHFTVMGAKLRNALSAERSCTTGPRLESMATCRAYCVCSSMSWLEHGMEQCSWQLHSDMSLVSSSQGQKEACGLQRRMFDTRCNLQALPFQWVPRLSSPPSTPSSRLTRTGKLVP